MKQQPSWWQSEVIYQIYPRSFSATNEDGIGDLGGITSKLDYLEWLGVDAIWLSPFYPSPMADFGYDIADYCDVDPLFGTLSDFDDLLEEAHQRGIKIIVDFVPNHTSDEHPWFMESRSSCENPKRDWYIWRDPSQNGGPPNNWESYFGGGAWEFDGITGQYYLCSFDKKQPDLNWRNPEVREAMYDVMRFWFERGVDGFRIDVLWIVLKDEFFRDNPPNPEWREGDSPWTRQRRVYSEDRPEVHGVVREMRAVSNEYDERVLIGEIYLPLERLMTYYGEALDGVHLPFNFQFVVTENWDTKEIRAAVDAYEEALPEGAWPNWVLGNHDEPRIASRLSREHSRVTHMLLLTLRGTPTLYYGDEIGMTDVPVPAELAHDPQGVRSPGYGRDPERSPMQWSADVNAGFCSKDAEPWLPIADDYEKVNVEAQERDPHSILALVRRLIHLRRGLPALTVGSYRSLDTGEGIFAYLREEENRVLVALNFGSEPLQIDLSAAAETGELLCSTFMDRSGKVELLRLDLRAHEGIMILLDPESSS